MTHEDVNKHKNDEKGPNQAASTPHVTAIDLLLTTLEKEDGYVLGPVFKAEVSAAQLLRIVKDATGRRSPRE